MGIDIIKMKSLYESRKKQSNGRLRFITEMRHGLGLADSAGNDYKDPAGNKQLRDRELLAENFSIAELAEACVGSSWRTLFSPDNRQIGDYIRARTLVESGHPNDSKALLESTGIGIDPTAFADINAFTAVVGGLIEVKILESFQNPALIADQLMPAEATRLNGQKVIGVQAIGDRGRQRKPGEPHVRAQFGERWIETPETRENALAIDVLKEAVFFDLTGQILQQAATVGYELAYRKELEVIDTIIGVTNSFKYNGTAYNTYVTSKTLGYLNSIANPLLDWTSIQTDVMQFMRQEDPHTGKRLLLNPNTLLVNPAKLATANLILGATITDRRTAPGSTQATTATLNISSTPGNPYSGQFKVVSSPLFEQRALASDGLNLSQDQADGLWFMMEAGKSFRYMQNYPLTVVPATSNQYEMLDKGIIATYFAHERGIPSVWSPWHTIKNTIA